MPERVNGEIWRREKEVRVFPDDGAVIRLIGLLLLERDEEWSSGRISLDMKEYRESILFLEKARQNECQFSQDSAPVLQTA